jgi:hypothetical protein
MKLAEKFSPFVGFGGSGIEHSGSATRELVFTRLTEWSR